MVKTRGLFWHLLPAFLLVAGVALVIFAWVESRFVRGFHYEETVTGLTERARLLQAMLTDRKLADAGAELARMCSALSTGETRITVILPDGSVLADSSALPAEMDNHGSRPEVAAALGGRDGFAVRESHTTRQRMLYAAVPIRQDGLIRGVLRAAIPLDAWERRASALDEWLLVAAALSALAAALAGHLTVRRLMQPVQDLVDGAQALREGRLDVRVMVPPITELANLADCFNRMATDLGARIRDTERERNEREALFRAMAEGVVALDASARILYMNPAAEAVFQIPSDRAQGRMLHEAVRNADLHGFVDRVLADGGAQEAEVVFHGLEDRHYLARATELTDFDGRRRGALVVLADMTRQYRLERIRRDFVANVSHELRTPVTSLRGCAETLLESAAAFGDTERKFLQTIVRQSVRLEALINDLLQLSRIERQSEERSLQKRTVHVRGLLENVRRSFEMQALEKHLSVTLECDETLFVEGDEELLERAASNLMDNAVKYTSADGAVTLRAGRSAGETEIAVIDNGPGIAEEHLTRLFERFYRADKARSRDVGGTGLGLSIVKHIAQLHGGSASVESTPGKGSRFVIRIPSEPLAAE